jgi:cytochrome P450
MSVSQYSSYLSEANFKNAGRFVPERWLGSPEYSDDKLECVQPFSVGPRNCIGQNLALHEIRLVIACVMHAFDIELCPEFQNWSDQKIFALWEKKQLMCRLKPVTA